MARRMPLVKRVEIALGATQSESEKKVVFARLYEIGMFSINEPLDKFYSLVPRRMNEINWESSPENRDIDEGSKLYHILCRSITPIIPNMEERGMGRRMDKVVSKEYSELMKFYMGVDSHES